MNASTLRPDGDMNALAAVAGRSDPSDQIKPNHPIMNQHLLTGWNAEG